MNLKVVTSLETIGFALVGSFVFLFLHVPLPWLLGPIAAILIWRTFLGRELYFPTIFRDIGLIVVGYMLGSSFTKDTVIQIVHQLPYMFLCTVWTLLISLILGIVSARKSKMDLASVIVGSVPGGLSQMLVISQEIKGIDPTIVVLLQIVRVLSVVFVVPFLTIHGIGNMEHTSSTAISTSPGLLNLDGNLHVYFLFGIVSVIGYLLARRIGLPTSVLTGPLIATAIVMMLWGLKAPHLPPLLILLSQLAIGINIGLQVQPQLIRNMKKFGIYSIFGSIILIFSSLLIAYGLTLISQMSLTTGFLSTAPGGVAEMGVTATVVHADLSMVSGYQLFRVFFILFLIPPAIRWWVKKRERKHSSFENPSEHSG